MDICDVICRSIYTLNPSNVEHYSTVDIHMSTVDF